MRAEKGQDLQWLWFGGFVITTTCPNILRDLDETDLCISTLSDREEEKVKQNGAQDENLKLLHYSVGATVLPLVGCGRMEDRDSHLSAIYTLCTVTFTAVTGRKISVLKAERNCFV
jgi:hypothetical protein